MLDYSIAHCAIVLRSSQSLTNNSSSIQTSGSV